MRKVFLIVLVICSTELLGQSLAYKDQVFTEYFRRTANSNWLSSDATISIPLPDGRKIWLFGDTHIDGYNPGDTTVPCIFQVRNSMMVQAASDRNKMITILDRTQTGVNQSPVKLLNDDVTLFWPGHGYAQGDTAYVFWQRYQSNTLTFLGTYLVKIYTPGFVDASGIKSITPISSLEAMNHIEWGVAVLRDSASQYNYIYGAKYNETALLFESYVARSPYNNLSAPWQFYNGTGWSSNAVLARKISALPAAPSYSVIKLQNGKHYMVVQENGFLKCGLGRNIYGYESSTPYGPFVKQKLLYTIEDKFKGSYMITYNTTAHPEFTANNELLISYNVNGICPTQCKDVFNDRINADTYRPKFVRVPFILLDPSYITGTGSGVKIYPNPAQHQFSIELESATSARVVIKNAQGLTILKDHMQAQKKNFSLREKGIYFIHITSDSKEIVHRLVIQ